jgi:hypothetical protein
MTHQIKRGMAVDAGEEELANMGTVPICFIFATSLAVR